ncbi:MAG TPA: Xaa-Pro peptidase family protein [Thermodesulfobacteriota bacterium]|nr:Xaa-Pro peptidase family protein [Thermodesulfobacteriota bacterium]
MKHDTLLIIGSSENNADLYYRTKLFVPDPFIFIEHEGKKIIVLNDLEIDRGREQARVDSVLSLTEYRKKLPSKKRKKAGFSDIVNLIFKEHGIKGALVPGDFPVKYADELRKLSYRVNSKKEEPFFEERTKKTPEEIEFIRDSLRKAGRAMDVAIRMISSAEIKGNKLFVNNHILTSEIIKGEINAELSRLGCTVSHTIVACGIHSSMPHHTGEGPIFAGQPTVIDIFPRSQENGYFGDMARTIVKGEPSKGLTKIYNMVLKGQKLGISLIKHGVKVKDVHEAIVELFRKNGFETGIINGKQQGFIHSTGHGLGLEIHESPRVGAIDGILEEGNVVTVEPGLYYETLGGVRIEDVVVVTKDGCLNLTRYTKKFKV